MKFEIWIAAVVLTAQLTGCKPPAETPNDTPEAVEPEERPATLVETVTLQMVDFEEFIELNGETEPIRTAHVSAQIGGRIRAIALEEGEPVEQGDIVLRLDTAMPRATIDQYEVRINSLENDISRASRLIERGLGNEADLERLEGERDALLETIDVVEVEVRDGRTRAPITGVVTAIYNEPGEWVHQGNHIARIIDVSTIVVRVGLPERNIIYVQEGLEVLVRIEATGEALTGVVAEIGLEANQRNRTFPLEIHLDNGEGRLRSGMRATVILSKRRLPDSVVIPRDSILQAVNGAEVMLFVEGTAQAQPVTLGPGSGRWVVVSEGLTQNSELVVRGHRALVQGEAVQRSRTGICCADQYSSGAELEMSDVSPETADGDDDNDPAEDPAVEPDESAANEPAQ